MRWLGLLLLVSNLTAADRWVEFRSGPFEVLTDAGERAGRERLADLEQFRNAVEQVLGRTDIRPVWPIRILVFRSAKQALPVLGLARDAYVGSVASDGPMPRLFLRECARILIEAGPRGFPPAMESGMEDVFSTLEIDGGRVVIGAPLPPADRNLNWARMHMLTVVPGYYGELRVLVHNVEQGVEEAPAVRNAFGKDPAAIDKEAEVYLRDGRFVTLPLTGRVLRPEKDFTAVTLAEGAERIALADLYLADPARGAAAQQAYQAVLTSTPGSPEALEGLGLLALRDKQAAEARKLLGQASEATTTSARACLEYARLETDPDNAAVALDKAARLNPRWALPQFELALREKDAGRRIHLLGAAAKLEPRNVAYWRALAEAQEAGGQFIEAAETWASAEHAAATPDERAGLRQIRDQADARRRQQKDEALKREAEEKARDLERVKDQARASIQAAIEKAQREHPALPSSTPPAKWQDFPQPDAKVQGLLRQVDCINKQARLVIEAQDGKLVRLLVRDPNQIAVIGPGEKTFGCGVQKPARNVAVEYFTKPDVKLGTAGEVAVLEFP